MNKSVSIIIPVFNKREYIRETINSVLVQTFENWEIIIVDDCSTDDSIKIIESLISQNSDKIILIRNQTNLGGAASRNKGIESASSEYVMFLDADDVLTETCLENRFAAESETSNCDFSVYPMGVFRKEIGDMKFVWNDFSGDHKRRFLMHRLPWAIPSVLWKKEFLKSLGGFNTDFSRNQDVELHTRAVFHENVRYKCFPDHNADCLYRVDTDRLSYEKIEFYRKRVQGNNQFVNYFYNEVPKSYRKYLGAAIMDLLSEYFPKSEEDIESEMKLLRRKLIDTDLTRNSKWRFSLLKLYIYLRERRIKFKGMNLVFERLLILG